MPEVNAGTLENVARVVQNYTRCVETETKTLGLLVRNINTLRQIIQGLAIMNLLTLVVVLLYLMLR